MTPGTKTSVWTGRDALRGLAVLGLVLGLIGAVFFARSPLTGGASDYAERVAATAAATYVSLRAVNAFLSTAQEIEIGGSMVVSGTAKPLKALEPIDDTIERIASAVFAIMVVSGILAVGLGPIGAVGAGSLALACALYLLPGTAMSGLARRLGAYGLFLAVALPAAFLLASALSGVMTGAVWEENRAIVAELTADVGADTVPPEGSALVPDVIEDLRRYRVLAGALYENASALIGSYISIVAVHFFNLLVLPALLAGGFFVVARWAARS